MNSEPSKHTFLQSIILHIFPGIIISFVYLSLGPILITSGFPPILGLFIAIIFVLIPIELGILFYFQRKQGKQLTDQSVIEYRDKLPNWQLIIIVIVLIGWGQMITGLFSGINNEIYTRYFSWFPEWANLGNLLAELPKYSKNNLLITFGIGLLANGIAGPLVEEIYFRGYLLPRIPFGNRITPVVNIILFSLYHLFSPWENISRILAVLPLGYAVVWKRNILISIIVHCLNNSIGMIMLLAVIINL